MCVSCKEIRRKYNTEVKNRFEVLGDIEDPEEEHDMILETYRDAPKKVIGWSKEKERKAYDRKRKIRTLKKARIQCEKQRSETKCEGG